MIDAFMVDAFNKEVLVISEFKKEMFMLDAFNTAVVVI
jgi:hypothetical protein